MGGTYIEEILLYGVGLTSMSECVCGGGGGVCLLLLLLLFFVCLFVF